MPQPKKGPRLGSGPAHQKLLLSGLASSLLRDGRIKTTEARAKAVRPLAERMITHAKKGDIAARRLVLRTIHDKDIVHHLFSELAPRFADRNGGYTRTTKVGYRKGDAAPMAVIELVDLGEGGGHEVAAAEPEKKTSRLRRKPKAEAKPASKSKVEESTDEDSDDDSTDDE